MLRIWRAVWVRGAKFPSIHKDILPTITTSWTLKGPVAFIYTGTSTCIPTHNQEGIKSQGPQEVKPLHDELVNQLSSLLKEAVSANHTIKLHQGLQQLSMWVSRDELDIKRDIECDENFERFIKLIDRCIERTPPNLLWSCLKNLRTLGVDPHSHVVQSTLTQLQWTLRRMSFPSLLSILDLAKYQETKLHETVFKDYIQSIERRWVEVGLVNEVVTLYSNHYHFSKSFLGHLDDRTIVMANCMSGTEITRVIHVLSMIKRRATPVLRSLAFHLAKESDIIPPKKLGNVLFAMNSLSFPDTVLFEKISCDLLSQLENIENPKLIETILICMGQMKWRHAKLLDSLSEWTEKNESACSLTNFSALLMTLATLGYMPSNSVALFGIITSKLTQTSLERKTNWLDVVWSLSLLGKVSDEQIASVLDPSFVSKMKEEHPLNLGTSLKLLNINAVSQLILPSYKGPQLNISDFKNIIDNKNKDELTESVLKMLYNLLPPPKYIHQHVLLPTGVYVDVIFATDKNAKPLPVKEYDGVFCSKLSDFEGDKKASGKELPEGAKKLALLVFNYKDYTVGDQALTTINKLGVELLEKQGYKVVQIPYFEYSVKDKDMKCVQYLDRKIKSTLNVTE